MYLLDTPGAAFEPLIGIYDIVLIRLFYGVIRCPKNLEYLSN